MSTPDPHEVARFREALGSLPGEGREVDAGRLFDALHGDLSAEERRAVVEELVANPDAARAWRLARELAPNPAVAGVVRRAVWTWLPVAAAVVLAVGLGWRLLGPGSAPPVYRGAESRTIASELPSGAVLRRTEPVLRWTGLEGARYRVRVLTADLELLEEVDELREPRMTIGADALRRVAPGGRILWQVEGRVPGTAAIVSPTFSVQVD